MQNGKNGEEIGLDWRHALGSPLWETSRNTKIPEEKGLMNLNLHSREAVAGRETQKKIAKLTIEIPHGLTVEPRSMRSLNGHSTCAMWHSGSSSSLKQVWDK